MEVTGNGIYEAARASEVIYHDAVRGALYVVRNTTSGSRR